MVPLTQEDFSQPHPDNISRRTAKSEHGSPDSAPVTAAEGVTPVPPLDISSFFPSVPRSQPPLSESNERPSTDSTMSTTFGGNTLDPLVTSLPPLDVSFSSFPATSASPTAPMPFQDSLQEPYFASPDTDLQLGSAAFSAPPVDWSSFPIYSDAPAATSTQAPSYASFDYNPIQHGMPPPSSSGDISEIDEFGQLPGLGSSSSDLHDLGGVSDTSEMDQFRISSASSFIGLPQTQILASDNLESIDIDDFLKTANESTAALEHQIQASMGMEPKALPAHDTLAMSQAADYDQAATTTAAPVTTSSADSMWPPNIFDSGSTMDETFFPQPWNQ